MNTNMPRLYLPGQVSLHAAASLGQLSALVLPGSSEGWKGTQWALMPVVDP